MKRFSCKAIAILTAVFFISGGIFVPTSFASVNELTFNEAQRPVPTLTLEQANTQTTPVIENEIPSGVAVQNENPLSLATLSLQTEGDVVPEGAIQVHEGESIQSAINQAQAGDIVYVHAGTYHESITLKQGVNLQGESRESTIIDGQGQYRDVILVQGDSLIEDLTVTGGAAYNGGPTSAVRIEGSNVRFIGNSIINNGGYGVYLRAGSDIVIERSFFKGNNLAIQHPHGSVTGVVIQYNTMVSNNIAINILDGVTPRIENNIITGSTFCAIYEFNWNAYASGQSSRGFATVANNTFFSNAWRPTYYGSSTPPAVEALTTGNIQGDPQFNDAASGDYSVSGTSPAFGRGAFLPAGVNAALDRVSTIDADYSITAIIEDDVVIGYRVLYEEGSIEEFYNDGRQVLDTTPPAIVFLSGVLTNQSTYTLRYTADGVEYAETRMLVENANALKVSAADIFGNQSEKTLDVMLDQTSPVVAQGSRDFEYFGIVSNPFPVSYDMFGQEPVSANGNLLIGMGSKDKAGLTDAGAVYLLDGNPDSLNFGKAMIELINPTPATNDYFGGNVAAFGDKLYVSATGDDRSGTDTGSVYMYNGNALHYAFGSLLYTFSNPRPSANDYFGCAMAADALTIAIAAVGEDMAGDSAGAVYLFDNDSASPTFGNLLHTFVSPYPEIYGYFGNSVYKEGDYLFIGATSEDHGASNAGAVYMYDANPASPEFGQLLHMFTDPTPNRNGYFGREIKMVGKNVLIGQDISTLETPDGEAYLFDADPVSPTFGEIEAVFKTPDTFKDAGYGSSMAVLGTKVIIGSRSAGRTPTSIGWGKAFVYEADPLNERFGDLLQTIEAADHVEGDYFGSAVAVVRNRLFVSAIFKNANGMSDVGQIYAYEDFSAFPAVVINAGDSYTYSRSIKLSLAAEDNFTEQNDLQMAFSQDGGQTYSPFEPYSVTKNITLSPDLGSKTIIARFRDEAGNFSDFLDSIELRQPVLNGLVTVNSGATYTASKTVTLNLTDLSIGTPIARVAFSTDGVTFAEPVPYAKTISFDLPAGDGPKTVYVKGFNAEGTLSTIFSDMIQLDQTGPTGSVQINNNSGFTNSPNITLNLTASDAISGLDSMRFSLDSGSTWTSFEKFAATKALTVSAPEGVKEVQCQFRDKLGNISTYSASVTLDKTIPVGDFEVNDGALFTNSFSVSVTLTFSDALSGLEKMQFFTTAEGWTEWENFASSKSVMISSWLSNPIVRVRVRDRAGNIWDGMKSIILDTGAPTGTVTINNDMIRTNSLTVTLNLFGSDTTSGLGKMRFSVDEGNVWSDWENYHSSKTLDFPSGPGSKAVRVQLMDRAGNTSNALITDSIMYDPTISSVLLPDQDFETYNKVRKVMLLGPLLDQDEIPFTYSFIAPENLLLNGQFTIYKNQLTYVADEGFAGSGVIQIQALGGNKMMEHNVNLRVISPQVAIPNDPQLNQQYGLSLADAARAWNLSRGAGVNVAILDTGIDMTHSDLEASIFTNLGEIAGDGIDNDGNGYIDDAHGWDFVNTDNTPTDDNGHGTHVSGIVAAQSGNDQGGAGIAPDSRVIPVKVLNAFGGGSTIDSVFQNVAQGILYAVQIGAKVINMSLGYLTGWISSTVVQAVKDAIAVAHAAGVVVVAAAGNDNADVSNYTPASLNNVITVSATDSLDQRATANRSYFSNYGSAIDLSAPGADIYSTYWTTTNPSTYTNMYGTSMASPFVAGLAAMILAQDSSATDMDVLRRMRFSATDLGTVGWDQYYGYGRIDAFRALSYDYYDNGVIKTQWLEAPDENGWNRLSFDEEGYLTGGTYVGISGIAGLGAALVNEIAPVVQPMASLLRQSFLRLSLKQHLKLAGVRFWDVCTRGWNLKEMREDDDSEALKSRSLWAVDKKKNDQAQKAVSDERARGLFKERAFAREKTQNQKIIHDQVQNELILKSVWSSPLIGTALGLALSTWFAGDM